MYNTNIKGVCEFCKENSVLVKHENGCRKVTNSVENCALYRSLTECQLCMEGHYMIEGKCKKNEDENCAVFEHDTGCIKCKHNLVLEKNECFPPLLVHT